MEIFGAGRTRRSRPLEFDAWSSPKRVRRCTERATTSIQAAVLTASSTKIIDGPSLDRVVPRTQAYAPRARIPGLASTLYSSPPINGGLFIFQRSVGLKFAVCNHARCKAYN